LAKEYGSLWDHQSFLFFSLIIPLVVRDSLLARFDFEWRRAVPPS